MNGAIYLATYLVGEGRKGSWMLNSCRYFDDNENDDNQRNKSLLLTGCLFCAQDVKIPSLSSQEGGM